MMGATIIAIALVWATWRPFLITTKTNSWINVTCIANALVRETWSLRFLILRKYPKESIISCFCWFPMSVNDMQIMINQQLNASPFRAIYIDAVTINRSFVSIAELDGRYLYYSIKRWPYQSPLAQSNQPEYNLHWS